MALFDFLVRKEPLRRQRDTAQDFAREQYDPSVLNPQIDVFRQLATEGISEGQENTARTRTLSSLFRDQDFSLYGGNQGQALAGSQARDAGAMRALAGFEGQLTQQDIQAQQQGRQGLAQAQTQARQIQSQQDAAIKEADLQYEAEVDRRGQQIGQAVFGVASSLAMTPFGAVEGTPDVMNEAGEVIKEGTEAQLGRSLVERGLGSLFGGGSEEQDATDRAIDLGQLSQLFGNPTQESGSQSVDQSQGIGVQGLLNMAPELQALMGGNELDVMDGPTQQSRNQSLEALNSVMGDMQRTGVFDREDSGDVGQYELRQYLQNVPDVSFEEFRKNYALEQASGFQNFENELPSMSDFENSWLGKTLYNFGNYANEFVSTWNPLVNIDAIRRAQNERLRQQYNN